MVVWVRIGKRISRGVLHMAFKKPGHILRTGVGSKSATDVLGVGSVNPSLMPYASVPLYLKSGSGLLH